MSLLIDLDPYRDGNAGVPWYWSFDGPAPGPHVLINALVHGNEQCGARAVAELLDRGVRPLRGRLTLGFANVAAGRSGGARFLEEDLNRLWDAAVLAGPRRSLELDRARELRPLIDRVDILLDLHSMQTPGPPLMLAGMAPQGRALAVALGWPAHVVCDPGHRAGRRLRDYGRFADPADPAAALLLECGAHRDEASIRVAREGAMRLLVHLGMTADPAPPPEPQTVIEVTDAVTIRNQFSFARPFANLARLPRAGTLIGYDGGAPVVTPYDDCVLILPTRHLGRGQTAVRLGRRLAGA